MNLDLLRDLAAEWRTEAETLRRRGAAGHALTLESAADDLERRLERWWFDELTIAEAAEDTGRTHDSIRARLRKGSLPDVGQKGRPRIRRCDLHGDDRRPTLDIAS